jgi:hypothetical protein
VAKVEENVTNVHWNQELGFCGVYVNSSLIYEMALLSCLASDAGITIEGSLLQLARDLWRLRKLIHSKAKMQ